MEKTVKIKNSWNEITVNEFIQLQTIEDEIELFEILTNLESLEGISELDLISIKNEFKFIQKSPIVNSKDNIIINGELYNVITTYDKILTSQFIDLQLYLNKPIDNIHNILSIILIPNGKQYNTDYDIKELSNNILYKLNIEDAYGIYIKLSSNLKILTDTFGGLFESKDEEDTDEEIDINTVKSTFVNRWGWFYFCEQVCKIKNCNIDSIFDLKVIEFLNYCSYMKEKNQFDNQRINEYKNQ